MNYSQFRLIYSLLLNEPDYVGRQLKPTVFRFLTKLLSKRFLKFSFALKYVWINLTYKCNLRCEMCGLWGKKGIWRNAPPSFREEELSEDILYQFIDQIKVYQPMILLTGGEPLLYPKFTELARYIKEKRLRVNISTNGVYLKNNAENIFKYIDNLDISIDGPEDVHNKIRGADVYQEIISGLKKVQDLKQKYHSNKPYIRISFTINNLNYSYLIPTLQEINSLKIKIESFTFRHLEFADEEILKKQKEVFQKEFSLATTVWEGFNYNPYLIDLKRLVDQIRIIKGMRFPFIKYLYFEPELESPDLENFYLDTQFLPPKFSRFCFAPWLGVTLLPNGDLWLCPDYVIGNIKQENFVKMWNNQRAKRLRERIQMKGLFPACHICASLYIY